MIEMYARSEVTQTLRMDAAAWNADEATISAGQRSSTWDRNSPLFAPLESIKTKLVPADLNCKTKYASFDKGQFNITMYYVVYTHIRNHILGLIIVDSHDWLKEC